MAVQHTDFIAKTLSQGLASTSADPEEADQWSLRELMRGKGDSFVLLDVISKVRNADDFFRAVACAKAMDSSRVIIPVEETSLSALLLAFSGLPGGPLKARKSAQIVSAAWLKIHMSGLSILLTQFILEHRSIIQKYFGRFEMHEDEEIKETLLELLGAVW